MNNLLAVSDGQIICDNIGIMFPCSLLTTSETSATTGNSSGNSSNSNRKTMKKSLKSNSYRHSISQHYPQQQQQLLLLLLLLLLRLQDHDCTGRLGVLWALKQVIVRRMLTCISIG